MTAQISEKLLFEGEKHAMCTNPLGDYGALGRGLPKFASNCTALWRGYVGTWEIINDRLYLIELRGDLESGEDANLETVFPGYGVGVGVAPLVRTEYCSVKGVRDETKTRGVRARISPADGGVGASRAQARRVSQGVWLPRHDVAVAGPMRR